MDLFSQKQIICEVLNRNTNAVDLMKKLSLLSQDQWSRVFQTAEECEIHLYLLSQLKEIGAASLIPTSLSAHLKENFLNATARNMRMLYHAGIILNAYKKHNLNVIGLKGIYLVESIYSDISLRSLGDIDLLVSKTEIPQCIQILQDLDYQATTYFDFLDINQDIKHVPPMQKDQGPVVELHWTILEEDQPFNIDASLLWERAIPVKIAGVEALCLSPEDFLIHLCLHLTYQHHLQVGLKGLIDVCEFILHFSEEINWEKTLDIANDWHANKVLWLTLRLSNDLLGTNIPETVLTKLQPKHLEPWIVEEAKEQLLQPAQERITPDLVQFIETKDFKSKLSIVFSRIFIPRKTLARLYDVSPKSPKIYFTYLKRLFYLLGSYLLTAWKIITNQKRTEKEFNKQKQSDALKHWLIQD